MMKSPRHVLGISGGKDSAALAVYMTNKYPEISIEFYSCDTGKELEETYKLVEELKNHGIKITLLKAAENSNEKPFDHFWKLYGKYLPSSNARWCTKKLKLEPFEKYVGTDPVISYVGIRGDENREGYISTKKNIQSIFPFRKNIWSEDVISKFLLNQNIEKNLSFLEEIDFGKNRFKIEELMSKAISPAFTQMQKLNAFLDIDIKGFNYLIFQFLKTTEYPLASEVSFPLLDNEEILVKDDIFMLLKENGINIPAYYNKIDFEVDGKTGQYSRSRSGCYFCFFQQKIEWIWLYEQHLDLFKAAMKYEKDGYTWMQGESLEEIINPDRIKEIKADYLKKIERSKINKSQYLVDILDDEDETACASCFI